jgi:hypothetical protein
MPSFQTIIYTAVALAILVLSLLWKYRLANYEFQHRSVGGIVSFRSLPHSWLHSGMKIASWATLLLGIVMTIRAAMLFL